MAKAISMMLLAVVLVVYYDLHLSLAAGTNIISAEPSTHEKLSFGGAGRGVRGGRLGGSSAAFRGGAGGRGAFGGGGGSRGATGGGGRGSGGEKSPGSDSGRKGAGAGAVPFLAAGGAAGAAGAGVAATRNHHGGAGRSSPAVGLVALGLSLWALLCQTF